MVASLLEFQGDHLEDQQAMFMIQQAASLYRHPVSVKLAGVAEVYFSHWLLARWLRRFP